MISRFSCALLLAVAAAVPVTAFAGEAPATGTSSEKQDFSHSRDIRAIIDAEYLFEFLTKPRFVAPDDFEQEFMAAFRAQATHEEMMRRLAPAFGKEIGPLLAAQLERQMNNPVYRKRAARGLNQVGNMDLGGTTAFFTDQELKTLRSIDAHAAMVQYRALQPKLQAVVREAVGIWSNDYAAQLNGKAADAIEQIEKNLVAAREANDGRTIKIPRIGFAPWDQIIDAYGQCSIKFANAFAQQDAAMLKLNYGEFLRPTYLIDRQHVEQAPAVIDQAEAILESTVTQLDAAVKERELAIGKSSMVKSPRLRKQYEHGIASLYAYVGDYSEAVRLQLAQHRQAVAFMQSQNGNFTVHDGKVALPTEEARLQAVQIFEKLDEARQRLLKLNADRISQDDNALNKLRSLSKPRG